MDLRFDYRFHAVGQGLFASGRLFWAQNHPRYDNGPIFRWVFDCGQHIGHRVLQREVSDYRSLEGLDTSEDPRIHLVCISHFDEDHIKGFQYLLDRVRVDTLVLPYVPLLDRLVLLLREDMPPPTPDEIRYAIDPVGSLLEDNEDNLPQRIVFVKSAPPTEDKGVDGPGESITPEGENLAMEVPSEPISDADLGTFGNPSLSGRGRSPTLQTMRHTDPIKIQRIWEFKFYNEYFLDIDPFSYPQLRAEVDTIIKAHLVDNRIIDPKAFIEKLQATYDGILGDDGVRRNRISLWMYAGPLSFRSAQFGVDELDLEADMFYRHGFWPWHGREPEICTIPPERSQHAGILYSGDGSVHEHHQLTNVIGHFSQWRFDATVMFQIPHHGSIENWQVGAAAHWPPLHAVVSARVINPHHPGHDVVADLNASNHCILSANQYQRVYGRGIVKYGA